MKNNKILSLLISVAVMTSTLAGCASKAPATTTSGSVSKPVTITFLNTKSEIKTQLEDLAKEFTKANPDIKVEVSVAPDGVTVFQKLTTMYAANTAPTLAMMDGGDIAKFGSKFADLGKEKWVGDASVSLDDCKLDGKLVTFPFAVEGFGFQYNKTLLDKAGIDPSKITTTAELETAFKTVQAKLPGVSAIGVGALDWSLGNHFLSLDYAAQSKDRSVVATYTAGLKAGTIDLSKDKVFNGLIATLDVMKSYNKFKADPLTINYDQANAGFGKGEYAFYFQGNWAFGAVKTADTSSSEFGIIPVPISNNASDYGNGALSAGVTKFIGIDTTQNNAAQQAAAKKFLNFIVYDKVGQDALVVKSGVIPAFKNITMQPADPIAKGIQGYLAQGKALQFMSLPGDHSAKAGAAILKYFAGKSTKAQLAADLTNYWKTVK